MTDKLIEQIKVDRYVSSLWANDRRRARLVEYEDRILADAARIEELEAENMALKFKLVKAVETLERIAMHDTQGWAISTLADLKGEDDE